MRMNICRLLLLLLGLLVQNIVLSQEQLAFPGAQGWGRLAQGGRYGTVYHVTNLNDSGAGSFRDAVSQPNRIVVFDVAGVIVIQSRISFAKNLYVAGQTAPGEGVTIYGDGVSFSGANGLICRYLRVRMGHGGTKDKDCAGVANGTTMIFDHCSFAWGLDETFSINSDGKGALGDITIQNCLIGQGLMTHSAGGLIQADNITLYRNLYCDNSTRNNKVKGRNQYANCLVYNWSNGAYIMGGDSEGQSYCNIQGNLFINGPSGGGNAFTGGNGNFHFYGNDNWQDRQADGSFNPQAVTDYSASDRQSTPYNYPTLTLTSGKDLIQDLLPTVGASLPYRDMTDCYIIDEVMSFGTRGELIGNEASLPYGTPNTWKIFAGNQRIDTDGDGMPDWWEEANGTNVKANDAMKIASNGYANIENYINSLTEAQTDFFLRRPMCLEATASTTKTLTLRWADYTRDEDGFVVEREEDGVWKEWTRCKANTNTVRLTELTPGHEYVVRIRAYAEHDGAEVYSEYSEVLRAKTRPEEVGIIDIDSFQPEYTWTPLVTAWTEDAQGWKEGVAWNNDGYSPVLFEIMKDTTVTLPLEADIKPSAIVMKGDGTLVLEGTGRISGENTSVNKAGEGTLAMKLLNDYQGATVLHDGVLEFNTLKNGGVASSIGASQEFAQNWIMDGGTYRYTGASTATNRSAKLTQPTTLEIASASARVDMTGHIEGTKAFTLAGKGTLVVSDPNFFQYSGQTILKGGELNLSTVNASKGGVGKSSGVVMAGGRLSTKGENETYETYSFPIKVEAGTTSIFAPFRNCYMSSTVTGSGNLQLDIPYVREYIKGNWTAFTGRLIANAKSAGNLLLAEKSFNMPSAVVELKNGARACNWDTNGDATLGGLAGEAGTQLCGSSKQQNGFNCLWHIGGANTNETFAGVINNYSCSGSGHQGTVSIEKTGKGYWRLTGANEYSGTTTVTAGRLIVNGVHKGQGAFTVASGAILSGQGTIPGNVTIKKGGTLMAGDSTITSKVLILQGTNTLQGGAKVLVMTRFVESTGKILSNHLDAKQIALGTSSNLEIDMSNLPETLNSGLSIRVFTSTSKPTGKFQKIVPERPSDTQEWDVTDLYTKGVIYIRDAEAPDAIQGPSATQTTISREKRYNLQGIATHTSSKGVTVVTSTSGKARKILIH